MSTISLPMFYDKLARHDWTFMMSDDVWVYARGSRVQSELDGIRKQSVEHEKLYLAWLNHTWHKTPKPERPNA